MTSTPVRGPLADHLLTPENSAFLFIVHSTVNVANGQELTLPELADLLKDDKPLDRTTINSWEDIEFPQAVRATGRRKLIICALWTEMRMAFAALDALRSG